MGWEYVIELEKDIGVSADIMPTLICRFPEVFHPIAAQKNLVPFECFQHDLPWLTPSEAARLEDFLRDRPKNWFSPTDGLRTVRGYLAGLSENPQDDTHFIEALELIESVLKAAERHGVGFYVTTTHELWVAKLEAEEEAEFGLGVSEDEQEDHSILTH